MMRERKNIIQEKSYQLAVQIVQLAKLLPRRTEGFVIGNQLLKSGTSVGANVEEAIGAFSKNDFRYKMSIALKEARETHYWLRLLKDTDIIAEKNISPILALTMEVMNILGAIVKNTVAK